MEVGNFSRYDLIIFDFHKTLTDSVYFDRFDQITRNKISDLIFRPPNNEKWDKRWMTGSLSYRDVLKHLSENISIPYNKLEEALLSGIGKICWNQSIWDFSQTVRGVTKTAIATINTDIFTEFIVPHYTLTQKFDLILNSYEQKHNSKTDLCLTATAAFGLNLQENKVLLIDDKIKNIDEFVSVGGEGYHYQTEEMFQDWLKKT